MANATIKITQLPNIGNNLGANTLLPVVDTTGTAVTDKVTVGNVANFILTEAGNLLPEAFVSQLSYSVANAAQPNITSVGTLNINTLHISGGTNGQYLQTDGDGGLSWVSGGGSGNGEVGGANTQIQFNDAGNFGGDPELTWDAGNNQLNTVNFAASHAIIYGNVDVVNVNATGNLVPNAIYTDHYYYANGYVFGGGGGNGVPGGSNTQVQFNNTNSFAGSANFTFDNTTNTLSVTNIVANGSGLSSLTGANVTGQVGYAAVANSVAGANVTGAVSYATTANSVAVGNVSGIGNIATVNLDGNASNILYGNGSFAAPPAGTGYGNANVASFLASFGSNTITTTGNVQVGNIIGNGQALTGLNGANVTGTVPSATTATTAGTVTTAAQPNITSVGTLSSLTVSGNISSGNANLGNLVVANFFQGNGSLLTGITANTANTVTDATQSNITGLGNLIGLTVSNSSGVVNFSNTANVTLGSVSNLHIAGGTANYVLSTDGAGNLSWVAQTGGGGGGAGAIVTDTFTGNGVQTTFTLSATPTNANYTIVSYNGALLLRDTYTLSGANITFVAPPAAGYSIEVTTLGFSGGGATSSAISSGSSNVSIAAANGNITMSVNNNANIVTVTETGFNVAGISNLGNVGNIKITGGTANYVLSTDGTGNLSWNAPGGSLQISDEGNILTNTVSSINFVGNGVSATANGNIVTVNVTGGTGGASAGTAMLMALIFR